MTFTGSVAILAALGVGVILFIGSAFAYRGEPLRAAATVADIAFHYKEIAYVEPPDLTVLHPRPVAENPTIAPVPVAVRVPFARSYRARSNPV